MLFSKYIGVWIIKVILRSNNSLHSGIVLKEITNQNKFS